MKIHPDKVQAVRELAGRLCEKDGVDIQGACLHHALAAQHLLGARIAAGSSTWRYTNKDNGKNPTHFTYLFGSGEAAASLLANCVPEIHIWNIYKGAVLDFTTRYLPQQALRLAGLEWRTLPPPDYFLGKPTHRNNRWGYSQKEEATLFAMMWARNLHPMID